MEIIESASRVQAFQGASLTQKLASLENGFRGARRMTCADLCGENSLGPELLTASLSLKRAVGQINVIVHAAGILLLLPHILEESEIVEYLSLGAGNTGRAFDLETDRRVAEFKFIDWKGGTEVIRQNSLFKDFYLLAEADTTKDRYLYLLSLEHPMKFFRSKRTIESVLSRNVPLLAEFQRRYDGRFVTVRDYYEHQSDRVTLVDILGINSDLRAVFSLI